MIVVTIFDNVCSSEKEAQLVSDIKNSSEKNKFVFIITAYHKEWWDGFVKRNELKDLIQFESRGLTNYSHGTAPNRLFIKVLSKTPIEKGNFNEARANTTGQT